MTAAKLRTESMLIAEKLGYKTNIDLPLLDDLKITRQGTDVVNRCLCLHVILSVAFGFNRKQAIYWLDTESLINYLTPREDHFLFAKKGDEEKIKLQIEGLWGLVWSLSFIEKIDWSSCCSNNLVKILPNLKKTESSSEFGKKAILRNKEELLKELDLAYCLHWAVVQEQLDKKMPCRGKVRHYVIRERRRAFEWLFADEEWDEVQLDT